MRNVEDMLVNAHREHIAGSPDQLIDADKCNEVLELLNEMLES